MVSGEEVEVERQSGGVLPWAPGILDPLSHSGKRVTLSKTPGASGFLLVPPELYGVGQAWRLFCLAV